MNQKKQKKKTRKRSGPNKETWEEIFWFVRANNQGRET